MALERLPSGVSTRRWKRGTTRDRTVRNCCRSSAFNEDVLLDIAPGNHMIECPEYCTRSGLAIRESLAHQPYKKYDLTLGRFS